MRRRRRVVAGISASSISIASWPIAWIGCSIGGQRRVAERRLGHVVEADHRQVARARRTPELAGDLDRRDRRDVVGSEDRRRPVGQREQLARGASADSGRCSRRPGSARGRRAMPGGRQRLAVALARAAAPTPGPAGRRASRSAGARARAGARSPSRAPLQVVGVDGRQARTSRCAGRRRRSAPSDWTSTHGRRDQHRAVDQRAAEPATGSAAPSPRGRSRGRPPSRRRARSRCSRIASAAPLSSSALNGSRSATRIPITLVRWLRRLWATRLDLVAELVDHGPHPGGRRLRRRRSGR